MDPWFIRRRGEIRMPKWIKWCLKISIVLLAVGIVLSAIGFWINKGKGFNIYWKDYRFVYDKDESAEFGNSEASNCSFNEITANMECGDLDFINCVYSANVNIEESFGDVSVEGECTTDSFGFDLDASFGDISVQGNSIDQSSYSENSDADIVFTVSNESGDTIVEIA